jgi:hypothetical protein
MIILFNVAGYDSLRAGRPANRNSIANVIGNVPLQNCLQTDPGTRTVS